MKTPTRESQPGAGEAGFTLIEALVAMVVLTFGLMAVTNLMLVAASSNTVANQGTAPQGAWIWPEGDRRRSRTGRRRAGSGYLGS